MMEDTTKKIALALVTGAVKKVLITAGTAAAAHGFTSGFSAEAYAGAAVAIVSAGYSFWNDYGKAIVLSQLEVVKAKSLAQAAKLQTAGIAPPTVAEIAAAHPTLTPKDVAKELTSITKVV